ncbi:5'-3'-deoxyribonucleotidase [Kineococcus glutinatus]|uniref:5'-3'-deoxyribonucleotidase n=1 Tax=Kineococcus glutinatus TaxID=1070872 RepID=A0ABP9HV92_9ACTN
MLVLVDQDQVLAGFGAGFDAAWRRTHPTAPFHPRERSRTYWIQDDYGMQWAAQILQVMTAPGFFRDLPVLPGAVAGMQGLLADGHDVRICTAPVQDYRHCVREKYEWVEEHLGHEWTTRMILTRDKTLVAGDVLLDDRPTVPGALTPAWDHLLFRAPYNADVPGRHVDWVDYREVLAEVEEARTRRGVLLAPRRAPRPVRTAVPAPVPAAAGRVDLAPTGRQQICLVGR